MILQNGFIQTLLITSERVLRTGKVLVIFIEIENYLLEVAEIKSAASWRQVIKAL